MGTQDIIAYWKDLPADAHQHPDDETVLGRIGHSFELSGLPGCYMGQLNNAPLVLLFLSPGLSENDVVEAQLPQTMEGNRRQRQGNALLPSEEESPSTWRWWTRQTRQFGLSNDVAIRNVAFLNIGAYKSKTFSDWHVLAALPSSRMMLNWAQSVLFPQAERGERIVVCLRSAAYWGLTAGETGKRFGVSLYAPKVNRAGFMHRLPLREEIIHRVREAVSI